MPAKKSFFQKGAVDVLTLIGVLIITASIPLVQKLVGEVQEVRKRASCQCSNPTGNVNDTRCNSSGNVSQCVVRYGACFWDQVRVCNYGCSNGQCNPAPQPTSTPVPPSCTVGSCCGCNLKYGADCECDIPSSTCSSLCPTNTPRPTSPPPTNTPTPMPDCGDYCSSNNQCASWCGSSAYVCRNHSCIIPPTSTPTSIPTATSVPPTSTPTPVCDYYSANDCMVACGTSSCTRSGSCYSCPPPPPTQTPRPPTNTPVPHECQTADDCQAAGRCNVSCSGWPRKCSWSPCPTATPRLPTSTPVLPQTPRPTSPPPTNTSRPTDTPLPTSTPTLTSIYCGAFVGYQFFNGKCYNCQFPSQSNPPEVNSSFCAPTSTPRPTATVVPTARPTLDKSYYCLGNVLYQRNVGEVETCTYGCDPIIGCKPKPTECIFSNVTYPSGAYRCSGTTQYAICENGSWLIRDCPTGKECYDGRCQEPRATPTSTRAPTTPPTPSISPPAGGFAGLIGSPSPTPVTPTRGIHCEGNILMDGRQVIEECNFGCNSVTLECNPIPANLACSQEGKKRCSPDGFTLQECGLLNGILQWKNVRRCTLGCAGEKCNVAYPIGTRRCLGNAVEIYREDGDGGFWQKEKDCPKDENGDQKICINGVCAGEAKPTGTMLVPIGVYQGGSGITQYALVPSGGDQTATQYHRTVVGTGPQAGFTWGGDPSTLLALQARTLEQEAFTMDIYQRLQRGEALTTQQWDYLTNNLVQVAAGIQMSNIGQGALDYYYNWQSLNIPQSVASTRYSSGVRSSDYIPQGGYVGGTETESLESYIGWASSRYLEYKKRPYKSRDFKFETDLKETALRYAFEGLPISEREALTAFVNAIEKATPEELFQAQQIIREKYGLPPHFHLGLKYDEVGMLYDPKYRTSEGQALWMREQMEANLSEIGVTILPPTAVGRESLVSQGGWYDTERKLINADWDPIQPSWNLMVFEHEYIHAFQFERYPRMPLVQKEFEAHLGSSLGFSVSLRTGGILFSKELLIEGIRDSTLLPIIRYYGQ